MKDSKPSVVRTSRPLKLCNEAGVEEGFVRPGPGRRLVFVYLGSEGVEDPIDAEEKMREYVKELSASPRRTAAPSPSRKKGVAK